MKNYFRSGTIFIFVKKKYFEKHRSVLSNILSYFLEMFIPFGRFLIFLFPLPFRYLKIKCIIYNNLRQSKWNDTGKSLS